MVHQSTSQRVAAEVRAALARQGKSQRYVCEVLGLSQPAVSRRLKGEVPFDVAELAAIAAALDVSFGSLLPLPEPTSVPA